MYSRSKRRHGLYRPEWFMFVGLIGFAIAVFVHAHGG
jgi:hypothetical protein